MWEVESISEKVNTLSQYMSGWMPFGIHTPNLRPFNK